MKRAIKMWACSFLIGLAIGLVIGELMLAFK